MENNQINLLFLITKY